MTGDSREPQSLIEAGRDLYASGLVTSHGGNLSLRRAEGGALISATGAMLGRLSPRDVVAVDGSAERVERDAPAPSSNTAIHLAIYAAHRGAGAVLHAHPVHAIARTLASDAGAIEPVNFEGQLFLPRVPVLAAGAEEREGEIAEALRECPLVMVRGHGSFARGEDIWDALLYTSALEEAAQILTPAGR